MKNFALKSLLSLGLLSLFVVSCSDDPAPAATPETPPAKIQAVSKTTTISNGITNIKDFVYNADKLIESTTDDKGKKTEYKYDGTKLTSIVITEKKTSQAGVETVTTATTTYTYDGDNISQENTEKVSTGGYITDDKGKKTYTYVDGKLSKTTNYGIDRNGDLYAKSEDRIIDRDANGNVIKFETWNIATQPVGDPILTQGSTTTNTYDTVRQSSADTYTPAYRKINWSGTGEYAQKTGETLSTSTEYPLKSNMNFENKYTDVKLTEYTFTYTTKSGDNPESTQTYTGTLEYTEL